MTAGLTEVMRRRDLLVNLARADLTGRYRSTALGALWFVLMPFLLMLVLTAVFQHLIRLPIPNYPIFVFTALLPWTYFQISLSSCTTSISRSPRLVKRARIPRVFIPLSGVTANLGHFLAALLVLAVLMGVFGVPFQPLLLLLPLAVALQTVAIVGLGLITATLNVFYRDVEFLVSAGLRIMFYATPLFYPISFVPQEWRMLYLLNPMAGIVEMYRGLVLYGQPPPPDVIVMAVITSGVALLVGLTVFAHAEPHFEDYV